MKNNKNYYDNRIVFKPWGYEYVVYRSGNNLSVTILNINSNKSTSLHCHPKKKTGFVLLSGKALIQLGLWKQESKVYKSPSKLMIRTGLFHSIKCISKKPLIALEFETPVAKNDLVRYYDKYGRENISYEKGNKKTFIKSNLVKFNKFKKKIQKYSFGSSEVSLEQHKNFHKLLKEKKDTIFGILGGNVTNKIKKNILSQGDIIKVGTIKKLAKVFKINKKLIVLKIKKK
tara:strand:+ start:62 stop:751 length:690 start_codon:yes stop_codon:yes gene_type:complete